MNKNIYYMTTTHVGLSKVELNNNNNNNKKKKLKWSSNYKEQKNCIYEKAINVILK